MAHVLLKVHPIVFLAITNSLSWYLFSRRDFLQCGILCAWDILASSGHTVGIRHDSPRPRLSCEAQPVELVREKATRQIEFETRA